MNDFTYGLTTVAGIVSICSLLYQVYHVIIGTTTFSKIIESDGIGMLIYVCMSVMYLSMYFKRRSEKKQV